MRRLSLTLSFAILALVATAVPASATEVVDDSGPSAQCPTATHTTIQAGVNAAAVNEQVLVCNGIYREQVVIGPAKDGVDLVAKTTLGATIKAPATPLAAPESLVYINGASGAQVRRFIIAGPGPGTVDSLLHGVLVENQAFAPDKEAQILDNRILDIRDSEAAANNEGIGVRVGPNYAGTAGRAFVLRNTIRDYQKGGVVVDGDGSFGLVATNTITGLGFGTSPATPVPAQQGIQVGRQAAADVNSNKISLNTYSGDTFTSFGILVFNTNVPKDPRSSRVSRIESNTVNQNDFGILLQDAENQRIRFNRVFDNGDAATAAADGGIGVFETGAGLGNGNFLERNDARTNEGLDCEDGTSPLNTWVSNRGVDDLPATICAP